MKTIILVLSFLTATVFAGDKPPMHWKGPVEMQSGFVQEMVSLYQRLYGTEIILETAQGSEGIREVAARSVDVGGSGRKRLTGVPEERLVREIPVAWDMLVAVTHKENPVNNLSLDQLKQILEGKITNWTELGGADAPIQVLFREDQLSGVAASMRQRLGLSGEQELPDATSFSDLNDLHLELENNVDAIAVESFTVARTLAVKILDLEAVTPGYSALKAGEYPLYRPLYFTYVSLKNKRLREIKKLLKLAYSAPVKKSMELNGLVPYLDSVKLVSAERSRSKNQQLVFLKKDAKVVLNK
jgi:phosphate transport system substrate-binding protein